jgi:4-hydroxythreonine-4-phosphate dehydrogenase
LGLNIDIREYDKQAFPTCHQPGILHVLSVALNAKESTGKLDPANAGYVLKTLQIAVEGCLNSGFHALVTGPVQKSVINDAGIAFTGHTEYLGELTHTQPVMMLIAGRLRVALATTHLPLSAVPSAVTRSGLEKTLSILHQDLQTRFNISSPRIAVAGLNPHAGEHGHLGREEIDVIAPAVGALRHQGMHVEGPLPADTLFTPKRLERYDAVLAMYHDQGLPVLKYAGFGEAVNVTLGLPIIRTSVDHGTALDLAGTGKADAGSLRAAFELAAKLNTKNT